LLLDDELIEFAEKITAFDVDVDVDVTVLELVVFVHNW
jgi:hypothetical protein